jgi:hypothetical protein
MTAGGTVTRTIARGTLTPLNGSTATPDPNAVVTTITYVEQSRVTGLTGPLTYLPQQGLKYVWVEGQEKVQTTVSKYETKSFNLLGDNALADALVRDDSWKWRDIYFTDEQPLLESEVLACANNTTTATCSVYGTTTKAPAYANDQTYAIRFVTVNDTLVKVIPNVTVVKWVVGTGATNKLYRYKGDGTTTVDLYLPTQNYADTAVWTEVTGVTATYENSFENYTLTVKKWTTGGGWLRYKTRHTLTTEIVGKKDYYTHSLRADHGITVRFVTNTGAPTISVRSRGNILLQDNVEVAPGGSVTFESTHGEVLGDDTVAVFSGTSTLIARGDVDLIVRGVNAGRRDR